MRSRTRRCPRGCRRRVNGALHAALALGHHAAAIRSAAATGRHPVMEGDTECRDAALTGANARGGPPAGRASGSRGTARIGKRNPSWRTPADTLALSVARRRRQSRIWPVGRPGAPCACGHRGSPVCGLAFAMLEREGFAVAGAPRRAVRRSGCFTTRGRTSCCRSNLPDAPCGRGHPSADADATLPIVAFSIDRTPALGRAVLRAGARGYVTKDARSRARRCAPRCCGRTCRAGPREAIALRRRFPRSSPDRTTPVRMG